MPEYVIRSHLKTSLRKKKKTLKCMQHIENSSLKDVLSSCVTKSETNFQSNDQEVINASFTSTLNVKIINCLKKEVKQECESDRKTEFSLNNIYIHAHGEENKGSSASKKQKIQKINLSENSVKNINFGKDELSEEDMCKANNSSTFLKLNKNLDGKMFNNNVGASSCLKNSSLAENKSYPNLPDCTTSSSEESQLVCERENEAVSGKMISGTNYFQKNLTKSFGTIAPEGSIKMFCGFEEDDLHPISKLWTKQHLSLFLKENVKLEYSNKVKVNLQVALTDFSKKHCYESTKKVKMMNWKNHMPVKTLPKLVNKSKNKSNYGIPTEITDLRNIKINEKSNIEMIANISLSDSSKIKEKYKSGHSDNLSSFCSDKVNEKSVNGIKTNLLDFNTSSNCCILKNERKKDKIKINKVISENVTVAIEKLGEISKSKCNMNKTEDLPNVTKILESSNLDSNIKKKNQIYKIPGISFIIGIKPEAFSKYKKNRYDCVICSLKEISLFSGEEMKKHVQSRHHLLNVLRAESYSLYSLYKHDLEIATKSICSEVLKYEEKHGIQKLSVAKSKESHLMMRKEFKDRINKLIAVQENVGYKKSILDLIPSECQEECFNSKNCKIQTFSFDTIVLVGDSRVDNLCIPQITKCGLPPRVVCDSCKEAKIDTILKMIEKNLNNIPLCKVLVIVLGFHFDIVLSLLNDSLLRMNKKMYLKEMISSINTATEKWKKSFPNSKFIWCFPCVPDFKRLNNVTNLTGQVVYNENDTEELHQIRNYFKILRELKQLWKTCFSHAGMSWELDLNMVFSKNIHKRQKYFKSFTDEDKLPHFLIKHTIDGFHFSPHVLKIFWRHILRRANATDLMYILNSLPTDDFTTVDYNIGQTSDNTKMPLSYLQTKEDTNEVLQSHQIKEVTTDICNFLQRNDDSNEVLNLNSNLVDDHPKLFSFEDTSCSSSKYDQVTLIADRRYDSYLKHWNCPKIHILDDEILNIQDIEAFLISKRKLLTSKTLYLVVIGIHSFTTMITADVCEKNNCDNSSRLCAIQPIAFDKFNQHVSQSVSQITKALNETKLRLLNGSDIAILPPLPISLMPLYDDHKLLHDQQKAFPKYMIVNSKLDDLRAHYMFWMKTITKLALFHLSFHINCRNLQRSIDEDYYTLDQMSCCSTDKPSYYKWIDLVENILKLALPINANINTFSENQMMLNQADNLNKFSGNKNNVKLRNNEILENDLQKSSKTLNKCRKYVKDVAYDHLVLIGKTDSLNLLENLNFCTISQWHLDDDFKYEKNIDLIRKQCSKKVLFVLISDASMIGCKNQVKQCIEQKCMQPLSYIGQSHRFCSLDLNRKHNILTLKNIMSKIEKLNDIQSQIIVAPFTPGFYVHVSNIILYHANMHGLFKQQNGINFVGGYTMKIWEDALKLFELEWKMLSKEFSNHFIREMNSIDDVKKINAVNCKILPLLSNSFDFFDATVIPEWKTYVMHLILNGWSEKQKSISVIESRRVSVDSSSSHSKLQTLFLPNLIQVELSSGITYAEEQTKLQTNETCKSAAIEGKPYSTVGLVSPSNLQSSQENPNFLTNGDLGTNATVNNELDDVILFAKLILNSKKALEKGSEKYENTFIIGKRDIVSRLSDLHFNSTLIYEDFSKFSGEMESLMNQIYLKAGKLMGSFICCLLFDISLITENIEKSPECVDRECREPFTVSALKAKNVNNLKTKCDFDGLIEDHLRNIIYFVNKLSKVIPVIILPLYPARIYCFDTTSDDHQIGHQMAASGCTVVQGSKSLWTEAFQSLIFSWNSLMKKNNMKLDNYNYFDIYMSRKLNIFTFLDNKGDITKNWIEPNAWKAFIDTFLLSVLQRKALSKGVPIINPTSFYKKVYVYVMRVSPSIPLGFYEELFKSVDEKVVVIQEKGMYILNGMIFGKAVLFAKKLNEFRIGETIHAAVVQGNNSNVDGEISLMQELYISSKIENVYRKWKDLIIENIAKKLYNAPDVQTMKSTPCDKGYSCKGPKLCGQYHDSSDKRRNPLLHKYSVQLCLKPQTIDGLCDNGEHCLRSHNPYEEKFHPSEYQAKLCPSGLSSKLCNRQKLCMHAHKDSPEMFYVSEWEDLIVSDISNTINFFAGAIRGTSKIKDLKDFNFRILLISSSSEFLDTALKSSLCLLQDFKLKGCNLESDMSNADFSEVMVGNPSLFTKVNPDIFLEMSGAILVDDVHSIFKNVKERESLFQFFKTMMSSSYNIMLNKVFVCDSYDAHASNAVVRITGSRLRHLLIEYPHSMDNRKGNFPFQSSIEKSGNSLDCIIKQSCDFPENNSKRCRSRSNSPKKKIRKEHSPHNGKVSLSNSCSQSKSKSFHKHSTLEKLCNKLYPTSPPCKSRSRSKSMELLETVERNISLIRYESGRTVLVKVILLRRWSMTS